MRYSIWLLGVIAGSGTPLRIPRKIEVSGRPGDDGAVTLRARVAVGRWGVYPLPGSAGRGSVPAPVGDSCLGTAGAGEPAAAGACLWAAGGAGSRLGGAAFGIGVEPRTTRAPVGRSWRRTSRPVCGAA